MRGIIMAAAPLLLVAGAAVAQVPPAELGARYIPAPWWMREPVIASLGSVRVELPANRARFSAQFGAVERDAPAATAAAARKVAELDASLRAIGADRVRLTTTFVTRPLYDQYRDKAGTLVDNQRADKIDRYEVSASLDVEVRDTAVLERAYNAVVNARPTSVGAVSFSLEPDNKVKSALATEAVRDATRRARLAADASGARLGAVKIVDPTARVCRTDVLAGWPSYVGGTRATDVDAGAVGAPPPPPAPVMAPPPPAGGGETVSLRVTLQPPARTLEEEACVVFALL
ncbi:MAG: SIMPL domain-containing protein [Janthinobacterium lividum]